MVEFSRIKRLPPYAFKVVDEMKFDARHRGEDIIDLGMGNPDLPTPQHIVDKMAESLRNPRNHRYSASMGIYKLRLAICDWYRRRFGAEMNPDTEACVTIGAKEGLSHLMLAMMGSGEVALVPTPSYPIHPYSVVIAGGDAIRIPLRDPDDFLDRVEKACERSWPRPSVLIISFPHNPTTKVVEKAFFERAVDIARKNRLIVVHDLAYADLCFDGYRAPSIFEVEGAKEVAVEIFTLSKSYNMPGWRVGFCVGNSEVVSALKKIKSYMDYGIFQPIQIAAIIALNGPQDCVAETVEIYRKRRDTLVEGLNRIGWPVESPKATMFVWATVPEPFREAGSIEFAKLLLQEGKVAVSPGIGFGEEGDDSVRFALVENTHRIRQALAGIKVALHRRVG